MKWRERLQMFVLTKQEQRTIAFLVLILVLGLVTKHYRATHPPSPPHEHAQPATPPPKGKTSG